MPKELAMMYRGHVEKGVVVLDEPVSLPEGAEVEVQVAPAQAQEPTLGEKLMKYAGKAKGLPADLARNHDHYLYGVPKK
jgi:predicted DNA-binding antitoxin AbrB/MazE fold protein